MRDNAASPMVAGLQLANARANRAIASGGLAALAGIRLKIAAYKTWIDQVKKGAPWDFKTFLDPSMHGAPAAGDCPAEQCKGFLTICGACYRFDIVANIHFGFVGKAAGFFDEELYGGAGAAQTWDSRGAEFGDPPEDQAAIGVGISMASGLSLCDALKAITYKIEPPKECSPCSMKWAR